MLKCYQPLGVQLLCSDSPVILQILGRVLPENSRIQLSSDQGFGALPRSMHPDIQGLAEPSLGAAVQRGNPRRIP